MEKEIWKPVRGFEDYAEISNLGQIHRFEREWYSGRGHKTKKIQEESWTYGYENKVTGYLEATIGGVHKGVHQWVYLTFVGEIPKGLQVNHIDENKHRNCVWNLNLMTPKDNTRWGTGIARKAAKLRDRKLSPEHKAKLSDAHRGKKLSEETKAKIGASNRGKKRTEETKTKIAVSNSKAVQALDKDGNVIYEFSSMAEAQRQGFHSGNISQCCRNCYKRQGNNVYKGLIWRFFKQIN